MKIEKLSVCPENGEQFEFHFGQGLCTIYDEDSDHVEELVSSLKRVFHPSCKKDVDQDVADMAQIYAVLCDDDENKVGIKRRGNDIELEMLLPSGANGDAAVCDSQMSGHQFFKCEQCGKLGYGALVFVPDVSDEDRLKWKSYDEYVKQGSDGVVMSADSDFLLVHNGGVIKDAMKLLEKDIERLGPDEKSGYLKELNEFRQVLEEKMRRHGLGSSFRNELKGKCEWLKERIAFLQSRMNSIKSVLNVGNERSHKIEELNSMKSSLQSLMRRKKEAEALNSTLSQYKDKLASFPGGDQAYLPQVLSEIKTLSNALKGLDRQLEDRDRSYKKALGNLEGLRAELVLVNSELDSVDCEMFSDDYVMNVEALMTNLRAHEEQIRKLDEGISEYRSLVSKVRVSRLSTILGCLMIGGAAFFGVKGAMGLPVGSILARLIEGQSHWPMLLASLAGVLMTLFGFLGIRRFSGKANEFSHMRKERNVLVGQITWDKSKISALLNDYTYDTYMERYGKIAVLREVRADMELSVNKMEREVSRIDNESNLLKVRIKRSKERLYQLLRPSGADSVEKYIEMYEEHRRQAVAANDTANKMKIALEGKTISFIDEQIDEMAQHLAVMESKIEDMDVAVVPENVKDLREEYELKEKELMSLEKELEANEDELEAIDAEAENLDVWEVASDLEETNSEIDNVKRTGRALKIAISGFADMLKDTMMYIGGELSSLANEILAFMVSDEEGQISYRLEEDDIAFICDPHKATAEDFFLRSIAIGLAVNEMTCGRGASPVLCLLPDAFLKLGGEEKIGRRQLKAMCESPKLNSALKKLSRTRQVIWIIDDNISRIAEDEADQKLVAIA